MINSLALLLCAMTISGSIYAEEVTIRLSGGKKSKQVEFRFSFADCGTVADMVGAGSQCSVELKSQSAVNAPGCRTAAVAALAVHLVKTMGGSSLKDTAASDWRTTVLAEILLRAEVKGAVLAQIAAAGGQAQKGLEAAADAILAYSKKVRKKDQKILADAGRWSMKLADSLDQMNEDLLPAAQKVIPVAASLAAAEWEAPVSQPGVAGTKKGRG